VKTSSSRVSQRIVSLAPSSTSILCALGAKKTLIGVTKWCADVAPVDGVPKFGDCWHMNTVEEIVRLRPSLVIGSVPYKQDTVARLLEQPINFLAMNPRSLADVEADIRLLASLVNRNAAAQRLIQQTRRTLASIAKKSKTIKPRVRVYSEAWSNPHISSPPWVAELIRIAGGEMIVPPGGKVSDEQVASADPELIILAWAATGDRANPKTAYEVAAWKNVTAIHNRQVHVVRDELLNTPGPPLIEGARELSRLIRKVRLAR
jgi:iron complex transport system substrate-binding protein